MFGTFDPEKLAARLCAAAETSGPVVLAEQERPPNLASAEAVLARILQADGRTPVAWKLGASTHASRAAQGFDRAWSAPFFASEVLASPASLPARPGGQLGLECELVFRLGRDMPANGPLDRTAVRSLVAGIRAGIEIPATRYGELGIYGAPALVADRGAAGWLVTGDETNDWPEDEFDTLPACLIVDGEPHASGSGEEVIDGPFGALCDHLVRMRRMGVPQPAGTLISIGSLAGFHLVHPPCRAVAEFPGVGRAVLDVTG